MYFSSQKLAEIAEKCYVCNNLNYKYCMHTQITHMIIYFFDFHSKLYPADKICKRFLTLSND